MVLQKRNRHTLISGKTLKEKAGFLQKNYTQGF